jgi:hypothetical protein
VHQEAMAFTLAMTRMHETWNPPFLLKYVLALGCGLCLPGFLLSPGVGMAELSIRGEGKVFYTNDVATFSASRRLDRLQDPTQPTLDGDLAKQGNDMVFEPVAEVVNSFSLLGRKMEFSIKGQGFVFTDNSRFNHGTLGVTDTVHLSSSTQLLLRYYYSPDLLLGKNEVRAPEGAGGGKRFKDEKVTTHFGMGLFSQRVREDLTLFLLGRYGIRRYNDAFQQRDMNFWTIVSHMEWEVSDAIKLVLGYHYERGLADGRKHPALKDDISYFNHFVTAELTVELQERLEVELGVDFEHNGWTTGIIGDERREQQENEVQGEIDLRYDLTDAFQVITGFQGTYSNASFEPALHQLNFHIGGQVIF